MRKLARFYSHKLCIYKIFQQKQCKSARLFIFEKKLRVAPCTMRPAIPTFFSGIMILRKRYTLRQSDLTEAVDWTHLAFAVWAC